MKKRVLTERKLVKGTYGRWSTTVSGPSLAMTDFTAIHWFSEVEHTMYTEMTSYLFSILFIDTCNENPSTPTLL